MTVRSITRCECCGERIDREAFTGDPIESRWHTAPAGEYRCDDCERDPVEAAELAAERAAEDALYGVSEYRDDTGHDASDCYDYPYYD